MSIRRFVPYALAASFLFTLAAALPAAAQKTPAGPRSVVPVEDEPERITIEMKRVALPAQAQGTDQPYSVLVPAEWQPMRVDEVPGAFLGPVGGDPESHPEMLLIRESDVDVSDPDAILANLKANAARGGWELIEGEVRDFGGARGLWIVRKLPANGEFGERVNLAVKLPLDGGRSLDVLSTMPAEAWTGVLGQAVEHMLESVERTAPEGSEPHQE